ncbi:MAG: TonB-dependent receptor, partial [Saprospiraceae bacterium]|nr:TonB-dependent receptor [Saprospiraceae bacterium]
MRKFIFSFVLGILLFGSASSQSYRNVSIGGQVLDSLECPMISATVVLLQAADSVISSFSITDAQGQFEMKRVNPGDYVLQISYVGYQSYSDSLLVDGEIEKIDIGAINMKTLTSALDEVVVNADRIPMMIKKDTIVYNADAFKTQPNDRVEDLLRKLPGMEVEADGTIKAQGEEVRQVLVDGKEFFGRDPQIATKNLPAAAVQNVEVFDKKSEMAEFTGIDDGQEEKAINLELKEEHKKGVFGSLSAGYGTEDR